MFMSIAWASNLAAILHCWRVQVRWALALSITPLTAAYNRRGVVVVDIDDKRLAQVQKLLPVELAASKGIELVYVNTKGMSDPVQMLRALTGDAGFDDIFVYAAVPAVVEMADELLAEDGCLNFFAGPTDKNFKVPFNFYNVHYNSTHVVGTSGGSTDDMKEAIALSATGQLQPSFMVTHIGGLDAVPETVLNLPDIPGGKNSFITA